MKPMLYILVGAIAAVLITTTSALAGSGLGGVFNLGQVNTMDGQTSLTGNPGGSPLLKATTLGTAAAVRGVATNGIGTNGVSTSGVGQQGLSDSGIGTLGRMRTRPVSRRVCRERRTRPIQRGRVSWVRTTAAARASSRSCSRAPRRSR